MVRLVNLLVALFLFSSCAKAEPGPAPEPDSVGVEMPRKEVRGVWVATVDRMDWPRNTSSAEAQKQEFIEYLELFKKYNVNMVVMQIRPMADAFYESSLEPWSEYITGTQGKNPGYDVLRFMIDETHKRGMEFHAWLNPYRISNNYKTFKPAANHIYNKHPEWTMTYGNLLLFRPALPEVRKFMVDVIDDLITKYDVDGIHFDDYFYPYPSKGVELQDEGDFLEYGKEYDNIEDFRRGNVNKVIEEIHNLIVAKRPDVIFSISPYGVWRNKEDDPNGSDSHGITNYDDLYADIRLWCEKGWIDMVVPQLYASTENINMNFIKMSEWWANNSFDCPVVIGHGLYRFGNPAEGEIYMNPLQLETQFYYARRQDKVQGSFLFNASSFTANKLNILSNLEKIYGEKTVIPFMGRETCSKPDVVKGLKAAGSKELKWDAQGEDMRYVVYRIADNKAKIVDIVSSAAYKCAESGVYAVSALNKDNVESSLSEMVNIQ